MKLSITATLTEEQVFILAVQKWWSATINMPWQENKVNPMSASEFNKKETIELLSSFTLCQTILPTD